MSISDFLRKHSLIILPLILVLLLDICLLVANIVISAQLERISTNINIAGRQRMLSQRMAKALLLAGRHDSYGEDNQKDIEELSEAVKLFDQTITAFAVGGQVLNASGRVIYTRPLTDQAVRESVHQAVSTWQPLHQGLDQLIMRQQFSGPQFDEVLATLSKENLYLLEVMNDITNYLERKARYETYALRALQGLVMFLILLSFIWAVFKVVRRERYYHHLMEKSTDLVASIDVETGKTAFVTASCLQLLGYEEQFYLGYPAQLFFDGRSKKQLADILESISADGCLPRKRCEMYLRCRDGGVLVADMVMELAVSESGKKTELHIDLRDISDRKQVESQLETLAHKDALTGLANRNLFYELGRQQIEISRRTGLPVAVMFIDLDGFKEVNDKGGHDVGDRLLVILAERINNCIRKSDCVARLGGDEFIVLISSVPSERELLAVADKLIEVLSLPVELGHEQYRVSASVGIAIFPRHGSSIDELIKRADQVMYQVKHHGKGHAGIALDKLPEWS